MAEEEIRETLKMWISLDDDERRLKAEAKELNQQKTVLSRNILTYMRSNKVDKYDLESAGSLSRSVRTTRPTIKRANIRKQLLVHFADQPDRVREFLQEIDTPADTPSGGKQTELLVRRVPKV